MFNKSLFLILLSIVTLSLQAYCIPDSAASPRIFGEGSLEMGQFQKYHFQGTDYIKEWTQKGQAKLFVQKDINKWLQITIGIEGYYWFNTRDFFLNDPDNTPTINNSFAISQSEARFTLGDPLSLEIGYFPFKYNENSRNLGEYLFRSGCYPGFLVTNFDFPLERLEGIRLNSKLFNSALNQDFIINSEIHSKPYHDFSLSYLASFTPHPAISLGGGINLNRYISVNEKRTTPKTPDSRFLINTDTLKNATGADSVVGDTIDLTFRGIKLMGQFCFDIKQLFASDLFGTEDLKIYGEAAILGLKDYDLYYNALWKRIPVMFGFNLPAFKCLDVLSFEVEWYGSRYPNNYWNTFTIQQPPRPIPGDYVAGYPAEEYKKDDWKWSVYAKKTFFESFSITTQFARDHVRFASVFPKITSVSGSEEMLTKDHQWYWMAKVGYKF